jgi:hypothetical protein
MFRWAMSEPFVTFVSFVVRKGSSENANKG